MEEFFRIIIFVVIVALAIFFFVLFFSLPGMTAKRRSHEKADAIGCCGWFGVLFFPCWIIAMGWAYAGGKEPGKKPALPIPPKSKAPFDTPSGFPAETPAPRQINPAAVRFKITGVDRESKMDTTWHCIAASRENAKVKAELEGIIVTGIEEAR